MTLGDLQERMTEEEVFLWHAHFVLEEKERKKAEQKINMRRR